MKPIKSKLNSLLNGFGKYIIKGILLIIPTWITYYVIERIANWVANKSEIFLFYLSAAEIKNHPNLYTALAVFTSFFLLCFLGYISEKTLFGKKLDKWLDKTFSSIKGIGGIYSFANKLTEIFGTEQQNTGKPVLIPFLNSNMPQVGYITNKEKVLLYNHGLDKKVYHYIVNFPPAFALMGGTVVFIPEEFVEEYNNQYVVSQRFTTDEAFKFNISGGAILPDRVEIKAN